MVLLEQYIFMPPGLSETYLEHYDTRPGETIQSYKSVDGGWRNVTRINDGTGLGDGGIISNAEEMAIFIRSLIEGDILTEEILQEMEEFVTDNNEGYGLGLSINDTSYGSLVGHDGATAGFASEMWYLPEEEITIIILLGSEDLDVDTQGGIALVLD